MSAAEQTSSLDRINMRKNMNDNINSELWKSCRYWTLLTAERAMEQFPELETMSENY